jgi:hypothetical protein
MVRRLVGMLCCTLHSTIIIRHHVMPCDSTKRLPQYSVVWSGRRSLGRFTTVSQTIRADSRSVCSRSVVRQHCTALHCRSGPVRSGSCRTGPNRPGPTTQCDSIRCDPIPHTSPSVRQAAKSALRVRRQQRAAQLKGCKGHMSLRSIAHAHRQIRSIALFVARNATCCTLRYMLHATTCCML